MHEVRSNVGQQPMPNDALEPKFHDLEVCEDLKVSELEYS